MVIICVALFVCCLNPLEYASLGTLQRAGLASRANHNPTALLLFLILSPAQSQTATRFFSRTCPFRARCLSLSVDERAGSDSHRPERSSWYLTTAQRRNATRSSSSNDISMPSYPIRSQITAQQQVLVHWHERYPTSDVASLDKHHGCVFHLTHSQLCLVCPRTFRIHSLPGGSGSEFMAQHLGLRASPGAETSVSRFMTGSEMSILIKHDLRDLG